MFQRDYKKETRRNGRSTSSIGAEALTDEPSHR
jgi:hypothetical protein